MFLGCSGRSVHLLHRPCENVAAAANTMLSPLSVMLALEMTRSGASGETLSEMEDTIYPGITAEQGREHLLVFAENLPDSEKAHEKTLIAGWKMKQREW